MSEKFLDGLSSREIAGWANAHFDEANRRTRERNRQFLQQWNEMFPNPHDQTRAQIVSAMMSIKYGMRTSFTYCGWCYIGGCDPFDRMPGGPRHGLFGVHDAVMEGLGILSPKQKLLTYEVH